MDDINNRLKLILGDEYKYLMERIIYAEQTGGVPVAFLDFDGTILDGDIVEGSDNYMGLLESLIKRGLSKNFNNNEYKNLRMIYDREYNKIKYNALSLAISAFKGSNINDITRAIDEEYEQQYSKYFWDKVVKLIILLKMLGVKIYVITASPTLFVERVKKYLPIDRVYGVDVEIINDIITNNVISIPYGINKRYLIQYILNQDPSIVPVIAVGNSIDGDFPMISYLMSKGALGVFVLDPSSYSNIDLVSDLKMTPLFVKEHY